MKNKNDEGTGIYIPETFEDMPSMLAQVYQKLSRDSTIKPKPEPCPQDSY